MIDARVNPGQHRFAPPRVYCAACPRAEIHRERGGSALFHACGKFNSRQNKLHGEGQPLNSEAIRVSFLLVSFRKKKKAITQLN